MSTVRVGGTRSWHMLGLRMTFPSQTAARPQTARPKTSPVLLDDSYPLAQRLPGVMFRLKRPNGALGPTFLKLPTETPIHIERANRGVDGNRLFSAVPSFEIRRTAIPGGGSQKELPPALIDLHTWLNPGGHPYKYELDVHADPTVAVELVPYTEAYRYLRSGSGLSAVSAERLVNPKSDSVVPSSTYTGWQPLPASLGLSPNEPTLNLTTPEEFTDLWLGGHLPFELQKLVSNRSGPNDIKDNFRLLVLSLGISLSEKYGIEVLGVTQQMDGSMTVHYRKTSRKKTFNGPAGPIDPTAFILVSNRDLPLNKKVTLKLEKFGI